MDDSIVSLFGRLGISLVIGMLVGLQRQHVASTLAGMRTFSLIAVAGTLVALLDLQLVAGGWVLAAGMLTIGAMVVVSELKLSESQRGDTGMTTAVAILIVFCVGAYLAEGSRVVAVAVGVTTAAMLQFKPELHSIATRLGDRDMRAIVQFAVFSCVILPVLPNENFGPLNVFNPFNIWLMVVLIVGISLVGYIVYKFFGRSAGVVAGGLLGGAISSTATAVSYARKSKNVPALLGASTAVIVISSSVVFVRVLIELAVVAPMNWLTLGTPVLGMLAACVVASGIAWFLFRGRKDDLPEPTNPSDFQSALMFGGLYALVLWCLAAARQYLGDDALYLVAALSGLTDMDAVTLSTGRMVEQTSGGIEASIGWRLLVVAAISNLVFKSGIIAVVGGRQLFWRVLALFLLPIACGITLLIFWR